MDTSVVFLPVIFTVMKKGHHSATVWLLNVLKLIAQRYKLLCTSGCGDTHTILDIINSWLVLVSWGDLLIMIKS